jgi:flavin reductase (DIM6/NTAB) family NADH-FMN oxidoreductase RutF
MKKIRIDPNTFIPMPVTLVGTLVDGKPNFMAVGWVSRVNAAPPYIAVGIYKGHYTPAGIEQNHTFSVNFPGTALLVETDYCGIVSGRKVDKSKIFDLFYGELKTAPMIEQCPLCLECRLTDVHELPSNKLFIGEIVTSYTEKKYLTNGQPDYEKMDAMILTMPDNKYRTIGKVAGDAWSAGKKMRK